jgi:hypothetical protein
LDRLKTLIEQHSRWASLSLYIDRVETYCDSDFSLALENAKAMLESISKEICEEKGVELSNNTRAHNVLRTAFCALGYSNNNMVNQISRALANIGQQMGNLRNEIGTTAHGKTLKEIDERNSKIDQLTKEFLLDSTVLLAILLIRAFEQNTPIIKVGDLEATLVEKEDEEFNDYWDEVYGEFIMGDYSYPASQILFNVDIQAYTNELRIFEEEN